MQKQLLTWYDQTARDLPWRKTKDPYAIWVSEIMLQQTRAETVIAYWNRFMGLFPTVWALAAAPEESVLKAWEGLGYYSRARNLHKCAQEVASIYSGKFPADVALLRKLPGIGEYTAGAVASIAFGIRTPAVDGNVERVVSRYCGIREDVGIPSIRRDLRTQADALVPAKRPGDFNQAMMELGARICQPAAKCSDCPIASTCDANAVGDAGALPIKQRKVPQRLVPMGVALVFHKGNVLLYRREERLLQGLWCFPLFERRTTAIEMERELAKLGIQAQYTADYGNARHVFTHLIWEMEILAFEASDDTCPAGWQWADAKALNALPLPTAIKAAKAAAMGMLDRDGAGR